MKNVHWVDNNHRPLWVPEDAMMMIMMTGNVVVPRRGIRMDMSGVVVPDWYHIAIVVSSIVVVIQSLVEDGGCGWKSTTP